MYKFLPIVFLALPAYAQSIVNDAPLVISPQLNGTINAVVDACGNQYYNGQMVIPYSMENPSACHHTSTGDKDLDRAVSICDSHIDDRWQTIPVTRHYQSGWENCSKVMEKWDNSEAARIQRDRAAQEEKDKEFIRNFDSTK